jgi:nicotinamidase-related amidase
MYSTPARIGWIVDVQNDFALSGPPGGRLYVHDLFDDMDPGAESVQENVVRAVRSLTAHCDLMVFTGDWHAMEDEEIDPVSPDPAMGTYPPHCMGRSIDPEERVGAEIIREIRPTDPIVLEHDATAEEARMVARSGVEQRRAVLIHKVRFSVFEGNPSTDAFIETVGEALGSERMEFYVLGHARDVCVTQFIDGIQSEERRNPKHRVIAISDCTAGLGLESEAKTFTRWAAGGAEIIPLSELEARLASGS